MIAYLAKAPDALIYIEARPAEGPTTDDGLADVEVFVSDPGTLGARPIASGEDATGKKPFVVLRPSLDPTSAVNCPDGVPL